MLLRAHVAGEVGNGHGTPLLLLTLTEAAESDTPLPAASVKVTHVWAWLAHPDFAEHISQHCAVVPGDQRRYL